jgi:hypothetical protein
MYFLLDEHGNHVYNMIWFTRWGKALLSHTSTQDGGDPFALGIIRAL